MYVGPFPGDMAAYTGTRVAVPALQCCHGMRNASSSNCPANTLLQPCASPGWFKLTAAARVQAVCMYACMALPAANLASDAPTTSRAPLA